MYPVQFNDGVENTVYVSRHNPPAAFRWSNDALEPLSSTGLPTQAKGGVLGVLDDGSGPALYFLIRVSYTPQVTAGFKWNGASWTAMPATFYSWEVEPFASAVMNGQSQIFGRAWITSHNPGLYRWNGESWDLFAATSSNNLMSVFEHSGNLFVIGGFSAIGGVIVHGLARWDGQTWNPVPGYQGRNQGGFAIAQFDDGNGPATYLTSIIIGSGTQFFPGVFKFDGEHFTPIGYTAPPPTAGWVTWVTSLQVFDDGRGPALYIAGGFPQFGLGTNLVTCNGVVRWDGKTFEPLGIGGTNEKLLQLPTSYGNALMVARPGGGNFGGGSTAGSALWVGCPNCYANCDNSTVQPVVNIADFSCFLQKFARNDPYANCNVDGAIDIGDFACFLQKFSAGCP